MGSTARVFSNLEVVGVLLCDRKLMAGHCETEASGLVACWAKP
jgi:hypothetical protein